MNLNKMPRVLPTVIFSLLSALVPLSLAAFQNQMGCRIQHANDWRYTAVNNLNIYRQILANGTAPNKCGTLPAAKNMYKLYYSCKMEDIAYQWTSTCGNGGQWPSNAIAYSGMSSAPMLDTTAKDRLLSIFQSDLAQVVTNGIASNVIYSNTNIRGWNNYVTGTKTAVGCSYNLGCSTGNPSFPYGYYIACVFDTPSAATGKAAYEVGTKCAADSDCTTYLGSTCDIATGLCQYQFIDDGSNTMCSGSSALWTDAQRKLMLQWHNQLRSSLAKGNEKDGISGGTTNAPQAKRMTKMVYNCSIEINADSYAQQCIWAHSAGSARPGMGENLYQSSDPNQDNAAAAAASPQAWWSELLDYGVGPDVNLTQTIFNKGVGHYTQMAWQETTAVGCGIAHCPSVPMTYVVCQYYPAGNYLNRYIYEVGPPCQTDADCGAGRTCSVSEALCIVS